MFDEAALSPSHSESVAGSPRPLSEEEPWGGMFFGQLFDSSPIKSLARRRFVS